MKIKISTYPTANPKDFLVFLNPGQEGISLMFARRLAAFFKDKGKIGYLTSGYRTVERQKEIWFENGGTFENGKWVWNVIDKVTKKKKPQTVATPGNSWHNGRCAIDLDDRGFWKSYMEKGDMKRAVRQQELYKYGMCLPLNYKDASTVFEWWHIQPIETLGYTGDRTKFLDPDDKIYNPKEVYLPVDNDPFLNVKPTNEAGEPTDYFGEVLKSKKGGN